VHRNLNYALTYHAETPKEILDECLRFAARHEAPLLDAQARYTNDRSPSRRLKIGYVAPDFRAHCQSMFTAPVLAQPDHASFEIVCYASVRQPTRSRNSCARWPPSGATSTGSPTRSSHR
jgi:predicted O-linked N-acetylglucosamine transferase (SPINDLY family)